MAGPLLQDKTLNRLMAHFYLPSLCVDVRRWSILQPPQKAQLHPLPLIEISIERIGMDLVGSLEQTELQGIAYVSSTGLCNVIPGSHAKNVSIKESLSIIRENNA